MSDIPAYRAAALPVPPAENGTGNLLGAGDARFEHFVREASADSEAQESGRAALILGKSFMNRENNGRGTRFTPHH